VDGFASLVGALLSRLRDAVGIPLCPGEWLWTVSAAGRSLLHEVGNDRLRHRTQLG
jgi:hypothetical protein